jgi:hypothetical protein
MTVEIPVGCIFGKGRSAGRRKGEGYESSLWSVHASVSAVVALCISRREEQFHLALRNVLWLSAK